MTNLNFWVSEVKKVKFGSVGKLGCEFINFSVSQKAQVFGERSILCFLGRAKVGVKKLFFIEKLKMDTGQFFWLICGYCCETMFFSSIWSNLFHFGVC